MTPFKTGDLVQIENPDSILHGKEAKFIGLQDEFGYVVVRLVNPFSLGQQWLVKPEEIKHVGQETDR